MIFKSELPDVEIPEVSLSAYVFEHAETYGEKPSLIDGASGRALSFREVKNAAHSLAGGLIEYGLKKGDCLALMAPNMPEYAVVFHGVAIAGCVITTINPTYTETEVRKQLIDSGARILVTIPPFVELAFSAASGTSVEGVFSIGASERALDFDDLMGSPADQVPVGPDDVVALPYSSGTTGLNKGVMLTHRNLIANVAQVVAAAEISGDDALIAVLPFFHIYGMQVLMNSALRAGATAITMPRFDLEEFLRLHQDYRITRSFVAPPIVVALAKHPLVENFDLSALRQIFSGAAPLSAEVSLEAGARIGCEVVQGYGMTELSPVSHLTSPGKVKPGSVGQTAPNTETKIVDILTGAELDVRQEGEVCVRGPQVMLGYLGNPSATNDMIDPQGWLHTGDIGYVDEDGHLFVVDRLKELIKYKGFQVAPAELEAVLLTHPAVADAAVVGIPDDEAGEIPVAFVALRVDAAATPDDIREYVASQVASYKQLRDVRIIETIPKSASGKILRRLLKE